MKKQKPMTTLRKPWVRASKDTVYITASDDRGNDYQIPVSGNNISWLIDALDRFDHERNEPHKKGWKLLEAGLLEAHIDRICNE